MFDFVASLNIPIVAGLFGGTALAFGIAGVLEMGPRNVIIIPRIVRMIRRLDFTGLNFIQVPRDE